MHGRTAHKEIDPGRFLRWIRAGVAACSIDLPDHGERGDPSGQQAGGTPGVLARMVGEIDGVVGNLGSPFWDGVFDLTRLGIGGMSAGGMAALRRLCEPHPFACAAVEGTTGWLEGLYFPADGSPPRIRSDDRDRVRSVDASAHLAGFSPVPLLMLHSESDELVPFSTAREFAARLRVHYESADADPAMIQLVSWPRTGAPFEHNGFGNVSNDAKNIQTEFFARHLGAEPPPPL